ncbi:helix-turn-helix domain-containing protein [Paenibacillus sp. NPDC058367]|uniref:helix-turn-helix domain-containing protein n=1 Tax=unclassified Paenibacillus TaxID=185978 RepID=UPI0030FCEE19
MENKEVDSVARKRLREYIISNKYVIREVAHKSDIGEKKLYKLLDGTCRLSTHDLEKICDRGLKVSPAIFFE